MKPILIALLMVCCVSSEAQIYKTTHFKIFHSSLDDPMVSVHFYSDTANFRESVKRWIPNPSPWTTGITLGDSAIHIISPDAPHQDYRAMMKSTIHEFAHCVSRHINKTIV